MQRIGPPPPEFIEREPTGCDIEIGLRLLQRVFLHRSVDAHEGVLRYVFGIRVTDDS